jgi:hypothetical protein
MEAGSRDGPALPPGLLSDISEGCRPTKLFIGGISRHTTTKQLRDHFAEFGRVLDCVAMRQPDGRPRGFGYVTLDSPSAAERVLRQPQMIDNRIVDMKAAVPEGNPSGQTSPKDGFNMGMFGGQADFGMGVYERYWSQAEAGAYGNSMPWWSNEKASPHSQGLDCLDLLSAARELAVSQTSSPHGLPAHSMGFRDFAEDGMGAGWGEESSSTLIPMEFQQPAGAAFNMSASAPEFVPLGTKAPQPRTEVAATPPQQLKKAAVVRSRPVLGELTNIVEVEDLLKPFKSPTGKLVDVGHGHLSGTEKPCHADLFLDEAANASSPSSGSADFTHILSPESTPEKVEAKAEPKELEKKDAREDPVNEVDIKDGDGPCEELQINEGPESPVSSSVGDSTSDGDSAEYEPVVVDLDNLPSIGSALHATGECKRCNFFPKGRCQNGKNCTFCHFPHDKRKPSRQEKRERRAAWLDQQEGEDGGDNQDVQKEITRHQAAQHPFGPLLSQCGLQQGGFAVYQDQDEMYSDETLAYSIFPGLPPIHATKLPAPLPLPGMDMTGQPGPMLPPGLASPWQVEASPAMAQTMPGYFDHLLPQQVMSTPVTSAFLGTVPTPSSTAASTPMPTPMATPTAAMMATEARTFAATTAVSTASFGTQTGDYKCNKCVVEGANASEEARNPGQSWARDELLRLRDCLAKINSATETSSSKLFTISTAAMAATAGN